MTIAVVEKLKLNGVTEEISSEFDRLTDLFTQACDEVSLYAFENGLMTNEAGLRRSLYYEIRDCFGMKAQLTQSVISSVVSRYRAVGTRLSEESFRFETEDGEFFRFRKSLSWLTKPIRFLAPQADLVRGRDFSFLEDGSVVSVATMSGRVRLKYSVRKDSRLFDSEWRIGGAKLLKKGGKWVLHVSLTKEIDELNPADAVRSVGVDMGIINLMTASDGEKTVYYDGAAVREKREKYARTRASLQKKGTKGAKRVLKRLSGRENGWMDDVNHRLSKALVDEYGRGSLFVLEDLSDATFDERNLKSRDAGGRRELRSWAHYDLRKKIEYKAALAGCAVAVVDPAFTSQRCPACGNVDKSARDRSKHAYACPNCGAEYNDDEVSSLNLHDLGVRIVQGEKDPSFRKKRAG